MPPPSREQLRTYLWNGLTCAEVARIHGCDRSSLTNYARQHWLPLNTLGWRSAAGAHALRAWIASGLFTYHELCLAFRVAPSCLIRAATLPVIDTNLKEHLRCLYSNQTPPTPPTSKVCVSPLPSPSNSTGSPPTASS